MLGLEAEGSLEAFQRLGVALAIGLLIGLERGWQTRNEASGARVAGVRTFALSGLLGGLLGLLSQSLGSAAVLVAGLVLHGAVIAAFQLLDANRDGNFSATGVVAAILTVGLGAMSVLGNAGLAAAAAVAVAILLALRTPLHRLMQAISWSELRAVLTLAAMSFLMLPILPDRTYDPWQALNPAEIWLMAILICAVSLIGYIAIRWKGASAGLRWAAVAGGLASSTATTLTFARMAKEVPQASAALAGGVLIAGGVMMVRVLLLAGAIDRALLVPLLLPVGLMLAVSMLAVIWLARRTGRPEEGPSVTLSNPFDLVSALKFSLLIAGVMLAVRVVKEYLGDSAMLLLAGLSGIADVDGISLSLARLAGQGISLDMAAAGIASAVAVNSLSKAVMAWVVGGRGMGLPLLLANLPVAAALIPVFLKTA